MKYQIISALLLSTSVLSPPTNADDFDVDAPIEKVVVYRNGGATITRSGILNLPAGRHKIIVDKLSEAIEEADGVTVIFNNHGTRLRGVSLNTTYTELPSSKRQADLQSQIDAMAKSMQSLNNQIAAKKMQLDFLQSLNKNVAATTDNSIAINDWEKAISLVGEQSTSILSAIQTLKDERANISEKIKKLGRELRDTGPSRQDFQKATIAVDQTTATSVSFELSYFVEDAGWTADVTSALDTKDNLLSIQAGAIIEQATGEDWNNIALALSNNKPSKFLGNVEQNAHIITLGDPKKHYRAPSNYRAEQVQFEPKLADIEEVIVTGTRTSETETQFDRLYEIKGRNSILSNGEKEYVPLANTSAETNLVVRALPYRNTTAYLFADTKLEGFSNIRDIEATLTRDGHYVGKGSWPNLETNIDLQLPYGRDAGIEIKYIEQAPKDGDTGFIKRSDVQESRHLISVTNHHSTPTTIEIFDRSPVPGHEDIKVATISGATKPTEKNMGGKQGLIMWRKTLKPGDTWNIKHQYRVTYPSGSIVIEKPKRQ